MALFDPLLIRLDNFLTSLKQRPGKKAVSPVFPAPVIDYTGFLPEGASTGRALVCLSLDRLGEALRTKSYTRFNSEGFSLEVIRALNERGYVVDVVDYRDREFVPTREYAVVITHGNYNACRILGHLKPDVISIAYESGSAQDAFERQTDERFTAFAKNFPGAARVKTTPRAFDMDDLAAVRRVSAVWCLGELTRQTLLPHNRNTHAINNSAVLPDKVPVEAPGRAFVCVAGSGNVQKGIDLVIAAFAQVPEAELYLASVIEPEILAGLSRELRSPNIHYVHHRRRDAGYFANLRKKCSFTVLCGLNSGQSTALVGGLGEGYVPVVNVESNMGLSERNSVPITGNTIEEVKDAIRRAMALPDARVVELSRAGEEHFAAHFSIEAFRRRIRETLDVILAGSTGKASLPSDSRC